MEQKIRRLDANNNNNNPRSVGSTRRTDRVDVIRRKRKPMMEKRRRARINASLEQLKKLVLDATRRDSARYSKLEKADILELTVKHIKEVSRTGQSEAMLLARLHDGFAECVAEVNRCLSSCEGMPAELHARLITHLSACLQRRAMEAMGQAMHPPPGMGPAPANGMPQFPQPHPLSPVLGPYSPGMPGLPPGSLTLKQQQQHHKELALMAAAFHQHQLSPGGVPYATSTHSLPGAVAPLVSTTSGYDTASALGMRSAPPMISGSKESNSVAFYSAMLQAHAKTDEKDRCRSVDSVSGKTLKQEAGRRESASEMEERQRAFILRELALHHGHSVWRPW